MATLREIRESELNFNQYGGDGEGGTIFWDGEEIFGLVSDVESKPSDMETGVERKLVSVRKSDIRVKPAPEDEIRLALDPDMVDGGEHWRVEKAHELEFEWDVYFYRYVS